MTVFKAPYQCNFVILSTHFENTLAYQILLILLAFKKALECLEAL